MSFDPKSGGNPLGGPGNPWQSPGGPQVPQGKVKNYLVESILSLLFCGGVLAIPAIIFASQVDGKLSQGDYQGAVEASKNAKTWLIVAVSVVSVLYLLIFSVFICAGVAGGLSNV